MEKENLKRNTANFMTNQENFMFSFRSNVEQFAKDNNLTIKNISEMSDVSFATLNSFLYGNVKDCKLSTAIKLSKAFGLGLDELIGAGTVSDGVCRGLNIVRNFPDRTRYMIHWLLEYHQRLIETKKTNKFIHVIKPQVKHGEGIYFTNQFELLNLSDFQEGIAPTAFMAILLPSDTYMPMYAPGDILLLAQKGYYEKDVDYVMVHEKRIHIVRKVMDNGTECYADVSDSYFRIPVGLEDRIVGYVVDVLCREEDGLRKVRGSL
ncbi:MAG: helix-turn-helix transcriptional regulator [Eubacterium sp.]|nr:helix-turn-helix transcriptional regulator [Eubacterium sp.]